MNTYFEKITYRDFVLFLKTFLFHALTLVNYPISMIVFVRNLIFSAVYFLIIIQVLLLTYVPGQYHLKAQLLPHLRFLHHCRLDAFLTHIFILEQLWYSGEICVQDSFRADQESIIVLLTSRIG